MPRPIAEITPAAASAESAEPPAHASARQPADWSPRVAATIVDFFVRCGLAGVIIGAVSLLWFVAGGSGDGGLTIGLLLGFGFAWFVYAPLLMARWHGQTVGHRACHTRVVMSDGSRMSGGRAFVREALVKNILMEGIGSLTLYILTIVNYFSPLWDDFNQALHDKMCGTRVIRG